MSRFRFFPEPDFQLPFRDFGFQQDAVGTALPLCLQFFCGVDGLLDHVLMGKGKNIGQPRISRHRLRAVIGNHFTREPNDGLVVLSKIGLERCIALFQICCQRRGRGGAFHGRNRKVFFLQHIEAFCEFPHNLAVLGIVPGEDAPAFELDFGKVGAAICFDLKFVEVGQALAANGARLCVFSSMFIGGIRLEHWARDFGMYVLSSVPARSYIIDMSGRMLAQTGKEVSQVASGLLPPIASAVINMDRCQFHLDGNQAKFPDILKQYGEGVEIENFYPEAHFTLASLMEDVTVDDIIREFELEPWNEYLARARGVRAKMLAEGCV